MSSSSRPAGLPRSSSAGTVVALLLLALLSLPIASASAVVSSIPDSAVETNGAVDAIATAGERTFVGGEFTRAGRPTGNGADLAAGDGSPSFASARPNSNVIAAVADNAGGWYIAGAFSRVGDVPRARIAHLLADGSVDPTFDAGIAGNLNVNALALSGNTLYAGGVFTTVNNNVTRNRLAAFDATTGAVTSFDPSIDNGNVLSLAVSGTTLYVGGGFTTVGNPAVTRNRLAAFDTATGAATAFDPNVAANVSALTVSGATVYAGGAFTAVDGSVVRNRIAAFDAASGAVVAAFDPNVNGSVGALALDGGTLYAGGQFTLANGTTPGVARNRVAAFAVADGSVVAGFDPNVSGNVASLRLAGSVLYVGGTFATVNGTAVARSNMAAVDAASGAALPAFDPNIDANVLTIATAGSRVYAGGAFSFVGASTVHNRLVAVQADGTVDQAFDPNVGAAVRALAVSGSTLYAGGDFTTVNGTPGLTRNRLAAFDATTGTATGFDPNAGGVVRALAVSGATVYAGGDFTTVGGAAVTRNRLAAFDATSGTVAPGFNPNVVNGSVNALALGAGTLYAGGTFLVVNSPGVTRTGIAAFDTATGTVTSFNPNAGGVQSLLLSGTRLYAGGAFTTVNGSTPRPRLAAFDTATAVADPAFNPSVGGVVNALALSGSTLYAGGDFATVNGSPGVARNRLAAVDATSGTVAPAFDPNVSAPINALAVNGTQLYAGGTFTTVGVGPRLRLARFTEPVAPAAVTSPASAITDTGANLAGSVTPNGLATTVVFEYGTSLAFGAITTPDTAGSGAGAVPVAATLSGLSPSTTYYYRLVATSSAGTTFGAVRSFVTTGAAQAPIALTQAASSVGDTSAVFHGQVNPNGQPTTTTFEYGTTLSFGAITPVVALDDANAVEPVAATVSGLAANTTYYVRVVATSASGTSVGPVVGFTTGPGGPPLATTGVASAVTATSAVLAATVDARGAATTFTFEYGATNAFGAISAVDTLEPIGGAQAVSLPIGGLAAGTTYVYRVVATNAGGTTAGAVQEFTTPPAAT